MHGATVSGQGAPHDYPREQLQWGPGGAQGTQGGLWGAGPSAGGAGAGAGSLAALKHADLRGLAAEFRRALPLLCSQTAFMEGLQTVEEEELIAALRGEFDDAGVWGGVMHAASLSFVCFESQGAWVGRRRAVQQ